MEEAEARWQLRGGESGATAEDEQIGERIPAQAIRTVKASGGLACDKQTGNGGLRRSASTRMHPSCSGK